MPTSDSLSSWLHAVRARLAEAGRSCACPSSPCTLHEAWQLQLAHALRLVEAAYAFIEAYKQHHQSGTTGGTMPTYRAMQDTLVAWDQAVEEVGGG